MKNVINIFPIIASIIICCFSCKNSKDESVENIIKYSKKLNHIKEIRMPKEVKIDDTIKGELIFNMDLDSVLESRLVKRKTHLFVTTSNLDTVSIKKIKNVDHKIFGDKTNKGMFKFYLILNKPGTTRVSFVIEDNLLLKPKDTNSGYDIKTLDYGRKLNLVGKIGK